MELPERFLTEEDIAEMKALGESVDMLARILSEGELPTGQRPTTEALRMGAALLRTGADRLDLIASRVEKGDK